MRVEDGARLRPAGEVRADPTRLLSMGYTPKHKIRLFTTTYYLCNRRYDDHLDFFVAYVIPNDDRSTASIYPRIFYKDISLMWRCATHYARSENENWIGKGALKRVIEDGEEMLVSAEETTNLPLEVQPALDRLSNMALKFRRDDHAIARILRKAPDDRLEPYRDFTEPRQKAMAHPHGRINGGDSIAYFTKRDDPTSLRFVAGFEPDFDHGVLETCGVASRFYHGRVRKFRILSANRLVQFQFAEAPRHAWVNPPQALTTEITTYGVRSVDVHADEHLFVPGYEYHYMDDRSDPPQLHTQIPAGFAGERSHVDDSRSDASAWTERLPVIQEFRNMLSRSRGR
jgi:hypothetical protein